MSNCRAKFRVEGKNLGKIRKSPKISFPLHIISRPTVRSCIYTTIRGQMTEGCNKVTGKEVILTAK